MHDNKDYLKSSIASGWNKSPGGGGSYEVDHEVKSSNDDEWQAAEMRSVRDGLSEGHTSLTKIQGFCFVWISDKSNF